MLASKFSSQIILHGQTKAMCYIYSLYSMWRTSVFAHVNCNLLQSLKWIADRVQQYMWPSCEVVHTNVCRYSECWQGPWEESGDACRCSETCNSTKNPNWIQSMASGLTLEFLKLPINVNECTCAFSVLHDLKWDKQLIKMWLKDCWYWKLKTEIVVIMFVLSVIFCPFCVRRIIYFSPLFLKIRKRLLPRDSTQTAASTRERLSQNGLTGDTAWKMAPSFKIFEAIPANIRLRKSGRFSGVWENGQPSTQWAQREKGLKIGSLL